LTDFYERTLGYLASIDPNHLRSTGGLIHLDWQQLYGGSSGIDGEAIFALADNTLPALHTYPPEYETDGTPIDHQTPVYGPLADSLGKPWFTEEFGWQQSVGDATRAGYYEWLYDEQATYGSDGALFWNLGFEASGGSHDVNPSTPQTWAVVQAN
jgi:endo-1,4-beta-mannosidase